MKRVTFTIAYILLISIATHINSVHGTPALSPAEKSESVNTAAVHKKSISLPAVLASGPVKTLPEPATLALFGFGFLLFIGFGWIKKAPETE